MILSLHYVIRLLKGKNNHCMPIKYIEYELEENDLKFQEISY